MTYNVLMGMLNLTHSLILEFNSCYHSLMLTINSNIISINCHTWPGAIVNFPDFCSPCDLMRSLDNTQCHPETV